jgi:hypothetical protein
VLLRDSTSFCPGLWESLHFNLPVKLIIEMAFDLPKLKFLTFFFAHVAEPERRRINSYSFPAQKVQTIIAYFLVALVRKTDFF